MAVETLIEVQQHLANLALALDPMAAEDAELVRRRGQLRFPSYSESPFAAIQWSRAVDENRNRRAEIADLRAALIRHYNDCVMRLCH